MEPARWVSLRDFSVMMGQDKTQILEQAYKTWRKGREFRISQCGHIEFCLEHISLYQDEIESYAQLHSYVFDGLEDILKTFTTAFTETKGWVEPRGRGARYLYFFKCEDFVKIGSSHDPDQRLRDIRTGNPFEVIPILILRYLGSHEIIKVEQAIHAQLNKYRARGEWFRLEPVMEILSAGKTQANMKASN